VEFCQPRGDMRYYQGLKAERNLYILSMLRRSLDGKLCVVTSVTTLTRLIVVVRKVCLL